MLSDPSTDFHLVKSRSIKSKSVPVILVDTNVNTILGGQPGKYNFRFWSLSGFL